MILRTSYIGQYHIERTIVNTERHVAIGKVFGELRAVEVEEFVILARVHGVRSWGVGK